MPRQLLLLTLILPAAVGGCAHYTPAPLDPVTLGRELEARNGNEPDLAAFLQSHGSSRTADRWSVTDLVLAAIYFSPELDRLRAEWRAAVAAAATAGAHARPDLEGEVGYGVTGGDAIESRWVAALAAVFTLELGGKRGARIAAARARAARAELELEVAAFNIAHTVRARAAELGAASARLRDIRTERELRASLAGAAGARYARGELRRTELAVLQTAAVEAGTVEAERSGEEMLARSRLASVVGLPARELDASVLVLDEPRDCGPTDTLGHAPGTAIRARPEVGRALAFYAVAEADLRLAVAGSYPDLSLGPGFTWDQGVGRWSLLFALPRLPVDGNRGPIAEALHRRDAAAAAVAEVELKIMADVAASLEACLAGRRELLAATAATATAESQVAAARSAFQRGEAGAEDTLAARLPLLRAAAAATGARERLMAGALLYERALGGWTGGTIRPPDPRQTPPRAEPSK
jgi:outer membrane protein TolC